MKKFLLLAAMMVALCASAQSYSLIGWINGADYGCNSDSNNPGTYLFENGKLLFHDHIQTAGSEESFRNLR